jgi:hypothetical protein
VSSGLSYGTLGPDTSLTYVNSANFLRSKGYLELPLTKQESSQPKSETEGHF